MSRINTPINQVRLTNVAIVRMTKGGKRFEIAAYRNKVVNYRQGVETDLGEVLQAERVFTNVSKGEFAKSQDLLQVFGTTDEIMIIQIILQKGDLQVGDLERREQYESMSREIATWISEHCIHPLTKRPYTIPQIRQAMKAAEYTIHPTRSMKKQYLDCFKKMQSVLSIIRAQMQLQIYYPTEASSQIEKCLEEHHLEATTTQQEDVLLVKTLLVDPSMYRVLEDLTKSIDGARLEILKQVVMREGDVNLEDEMRETQQLQQDQHISMEQVTQQLKNVTVAEAAPPVVAAAAVSKPDMDDDDDDYTPIETVRQTQKQAQKKSKKAKRREKEETEERKARMDAEEKRRSERADLLGEPTVRSGTSVADSATSSSTKACNTCGGAFSPTDYRAHFRSDWHRYNIKLKLKNVATVSEREFLLCDSDLFFEN